MRMRTVLGSIIALLLLACLAGPAAAITAFGGNPFYRPPLTSVKQMKTMFMEQKEDVRKGLEKAGLGEVYDSLMLQLPDAQVATVEYYKGKKLQWMFYRRNGKGPVLIDRDVVWESDSPFAGFEFFVDHNRKRYTFVVPLVCGNLALADVGPIPTPVLPVATPSPSPTPTPTPTPEPTPAPAEAAPAALPFAFVADLGYLYQADPAHYLLLRGGIEYPLNDNLSLLGMIGVTPKLEGIDGETAFLIDVMLNYNWTKMFVGVGLGAWLTGGDSDLDTEDNDLDIILDIGYQFYEKPDAYKLSGFIELRSAVDEFSDFDLYGRVGAGLRFNF